MNSYPNPWNFSNSDKNLFSFDKKYKIEYGELYEIGMGAPLSGECYLVDSENKKILLNNWCAGPIVWETNSHKLLLPIWSKSFFKGTVQKIAIADILKKEITIYTQTFNVLDIRTFDENIISGYDSPIYKTKVLNLDVTKMEIEVVKKI